ncbi:hypothetical protein QGP82_21540 [Leptothoe sp. LEGE 181152]|nr:hypothetical protein [Leptothoe sp. LEGE 181152]
MNSYPNSYDYFPSSPLRLGAGIDIRDITKVFPKVIKYRESRPPGGTRETNFNLRSISSRSEMYEELGFSASIAGQYSLYSGNASVNFNKHSTSTRDSFTWMLTGSSDYGNVEASELQLPKEFKSLIESGKTEEFIRRCGTHFVLLEQRKVVVSAIFTLYNLSESQKSRLSSSFEGGASSVGWSANVKASYNKLIQSAFIANQLSVSIFVVGGDGISDLSDTIKGFSDIDSITEDLARVAKKFTFETAVPYKFQVASMEFFGLETPDLGPILSRDRAISELVLKYEECILGIQRCEKIVRGTSPISKFIDQKTVSYFQDTVLPSYREKRKEIQDVAVACRENNQTCSQAFDIDLPVAEWPELLPKVEVLKLVRRLIKKEGDFGIETVYLQVAGKFIAHSGLKLQLRSRATYEYKLITGDPQVWREQQELKTRVQKPQPEYLEYELLINVPFDEFPFPFFIPRAATIYIKLIEFKILIKDSLGRQKLLNVSIPFESPQSPFREALQLMSEEPEGYNVIADLDYDQAVDYLVDLDWS